MSELTTRSITGIFIGAVTLAAIILSPWSFLAWLCVIVLIGTYEYLRLEKVPMNSFTGMVTPLALAAATGFAGVLALWGLDPIILLAVLPVMMAILVFVQMSLVRIPEQLVLLHKSVLSAGTYIGLPAISGCLFLIDGYNWRFFFIAIICIWMNDIGAYLIGSRWGKHKIAPTISPGKSIEGTIGGGLVSVLTGIVMLQVFPEIPSGYILLLGCTTPFFALAGDLWESAIKRHAGVKDSGKLLPGHGGILDRYDSLFFMLPIAALAYYIFAT